MFGILRRGCGLPKSSEYKITGYGQAVVYLKSGVLEVK